MTPSAHESDKPRLPIDILEDGLNYLLTSSTQTKETDHEVLRSLAALGIVTGPNVEDIGYVTSVMQTMLPKVEYIYEKIQERSNPDKLLVKQSERYTRVIDASKAMFEDLTEVEDILQVKSVESVQVNEIKKATAALESHKLSDGELLTEDEKNLVLEIINKKTTDMPYRKNLIATFRDGKSDDHKPSSEDGVYLRKAVDKVIKYVYEASEDGIITTKMLIQLLIPETYPNYVKNKKKLKQFFAKHFFGRPENVAQNKREKFVIKVGKKDTKPNQFSGYQPRPEYLYVLSSNYAKELGVNAKVSN